MKTFVIPFFFIFSSIIAYATNITTGYICNTPKNAIYPYACDQEKWGFSDKDGNIKVPCKYEATYIIQGVCFYPNTMREDAYIVKKKGKLYILDKGREIKFWQKDTLPAIREIHSQYIIFKHHRKEEYQVYLRKNKKLIDQKFIIKPVIDTLDNQIYGHFTKDSILVVGKSGKTKFKSKGTGIKKFGKTYLVIENYWYISKIYSGNGNLISGAKYKYSPNTLLDKNIFLYLEDTEDIKVLYLNGIIKNTKVKTDQKVINFTQYEGINIIAKHHNKDSISVYNQKGLKIIDENIHKIFHQENSAYLIAKDKTYKIGKHNKLIKTFDFDLSERIGDTFLRYYGKDYGTYQQKIDSTYIFDQELNLIKKVNGYVIDVFFDSLFYVNTFQSKYLIDYKNDTLIFCDKSKITGIDEILLEELNKCIRDLSDLYSRQLNINYIDYIFENGKLQEIEQHSRNSMQYNFFCSESLSNTKLECKIDTILIPKKSFSQYKSYWEIESERMTLYESRFYNNRNYGYLDSKRDTIMPFIYYQGIRFDHFIMFENDTMWILFDTITFEKKSFLISSLINGNDHDLYPHLFYTIPNASGYKEHIFHIKLGQLLEGKAIDHFDEYSNHFFEVQLGKNDPIMLIQANTGLLIDDFESYTSFDDHKLIKVLHKDNHVIIDGETNEYFLLHLSFSEAQNNMSSCYRSDLPQFILGNTPFYLNPKTMKFLASDELIEKLRIRKYKSIFPKQ